MKPLKLTMTAFGPYKNQEVIDFTELQNNRLFVVSGNTGAGKTTIFDGICFALYGAASGEDRNDTKLLRSDFADDNTHSAVELTFELHGRCYRILRQMPHVKAGNKSATGERNEFYEIIEGKEIPCVDRQIVTEINKKIEELIGLSKDQFSQIVMLPQGEFRKLLTSQTENKEEILRKIFKTEPYKWISEKLKEKKRVAEERYKLEQQTRDHFIQNIEAALPARELSPIFNVLSQDHYNIHQLLAGLEEEATFYREEIVTNKKNSEKASIAYDKKRGEYHEAKSLNERFDELEEKRKQLLDLKQQQSGYAEKEKQLVLAEKAKSIELYESQVQEWRLDVKGKQQALQSARNQQKQVEQLLSKAEESYQKEEAKKDERDAVARKVDRLKDHLPIVKELNDRKEDVMKRQNELQQVSRNLQTIESRVKDGRAAKIELTNKIKQMDQAVEELSTKYQQLADMRVMCSELQGVLKLQDKQNKLANDVTKHEQVYLKVKQAYNDLEKAWIDGQASLLAAHLHDGAPCPVCGSHDHPNKALQHDKMPTKKELEALKQDFNEKDSRYRNELADLNHVKNQLQEKAEEVKQYDVTLENIQQKYAELVADGKKLKQDVDALTKDKERLVQLKKRLEEHEMELEQLENKKTAFEKAYQEQKSSYEAKKAVYEEKLQSIPEEVRDLQQLEKKIQESELLKKTLEAAWEQAQKQLHQVNEESARVSSNVTHAEKQWTDSLARKEAAENQYKEQLLKAGFENEEAYQLAKMPETMRVELAEEINTFKQDLVTVTKQVEELTVSLQDKTRADLELLQKEANDLKESYENALRKLDLSRKHQDAALELKEKIAASSKQVAELEQKLGRITDLYDVVRGQNSSKISFERYLQIEFLEQIIAVANERLRKISNGQFYLIRSDRQESRGRQSGLGLDVYDAYTGQTRDVKSLSGGEKFNASLCLALGMADVIQSFQGGVSIETMFIDEGFGSLDEESLNKSIDTLVDLQQTGRMIGVISHVQELKTAIPAILEVKKTKEGYSKTTFVIK